VALADTTVTELLDELAARTPAPAGGTAAGIAGATAAALTEMAAAFALQRSGGEHESLASLKRRAGELRAQLLALADADVSSYEPVLTALSIEREDARRADALQAALAAAAEVPLQIAVSSAEVAEFAAVLATAQGNELLAGDAYAALAIAVAATDAAAQLVELNLEHAPHDPRLQRARALRGDARRNHLKLFLDHLGCAAGDHGAAAVPRRTGGSAG
jgi:formiminotetrahydrofolate cyclodeaminase